MLTISVDKSAVLEGENWIRTTRRSGFSDTSLQYNQRFRTTYRFLPPHPARINNIVFPGDISAGYLEDASPRRIPPSDVGPLGTIVERELLPFDESATPFDPQYTLGEPHSYRVDISNARPFVKIEALSPSLLTEGAAAEFRITRIDGIGLSATFDLELVVDVEQTGEYVTGATGRRTITVPAAIDQPVFTPPTDEFTLSFATEDDDRHEAAGTLKVVIADPPTGASDDATTLRTYQILLPREASLDLADNDDEPELELPGSLTTPEEEATLEVPVNLSNTADRQIKMKWRTKPATGPGDPAATAGTDYQAGSGELVFEPGEKAKTVTIAILDDVLVEDDERFLVEVYDFEGPVRGTDPSQIEVSIPNRDTAPTITVADESADEASGPLVFTIGLSEAYAAEATASYRFVHGNTSDADFASAPASGTARFAAGETAFTISLPLVDDALDEFDETLTLVVDNPVNAILDADPTVESLEAVGTIRDDDPEPVISITGSTVEEEAGPLRFTVSLDAPSGKEVGFAWETLEAGEGSVVSTASRTDYIAASGNLVFSPGETKKTIEITLVSDEAEEEDYETVVVRLSGITHATYPPGPPRAAGRITDDDLPLVTIEIVGAAVRTEGDRISFRARRTDSDLHDSLTVFAHTVPTGSFGVLGANRICLITIPRGQSSAVGCYRSTSDDHRDEPDGSATGELRPHPRGYRIGTPSEATFTIRDNDPTPVLSIDDPTVSEGDGKVVFTVELSGESDATISVPYTPAAGTATLTADYLNPTAPLTFAPGETRKTLEATVLDDDIEEADVETFTVTLRATPGAAVGPNSVGTARIRDDDLPTVAVEAVAAEVTEGDAYGPRFTLTRTGDLNRQISVVLRIAQPVGDAAFHNGRPLGRNEVRAELGIGASIDSFTFEVPIRPDGRDEVDAEIRLTIEEDPAYRIVAGKESATVTVLDIDPPPDLSVAASSGNEGDGSIPFTVTLSAASDKEVTVGYGVTPGTAEAGSDYTDVSGTLTIAPRARSGTFSVPLLDDATDEDDQTFTVDLENPVNGNIATVDLENPVNGNIATGSATGTIVDNDGPPALRIADEAGAEADGTIVFAVEVTPLSEKTVKVQYRTADGTAAAGSDYTSKTGTLTIAPKTADGEFEVDLLTDALDEANETFTAELHTPSNATLADASATGTILDSNGDPSLSVTNATAGESDGGIEFTVTLSPVSAQTVTVDWATADGTAAAGSDFATSSSGALSFAPNETTKTFRVTLIADQVDEDAETFHVDLSNASNAGIAMARATGTITDDDERGVVVSAESLEVVEESSAAYSVRLATQPTATVTVEMATDLGTSDASVDRTTLTFTDQNWNTPQEIAVSLKKDFDAVTDPDVALAHTVSGGDYEGLAAPSVSVSFVDNDEIMLITTVFDPVAPGAVGEVVAEDAGTVTITVTATTTGPNLPPPDLRLTVGSRSVTARFGSDYVSLSEIVNLPPDAFTLIDEGARYRAQTTLELTLVDDLTEEPEETFNLSWLSPWLYRLLLPGAQGRQPVTIRDDDPPSVALSSDDDFPANGTFTVKLAFSSEVDATTLALGDFEVTNGAAENLRGSGDAWTVDIAPGRGLADAEAVVTLPMDAWANESGNTNLKAATARFRVDTRAPELVSAALDRWTLTLRYDETLDEDSEPPASAFTVFVGTREAERTPTGVEVSGDTVTLSLATAVAGGQPVKVSYRPPAANPTRDPAGNDAAALAKESVTNNSPAAPNLGFELVERSDDPVPGLPAPGEFCIRVIASTPWDPSGIGSALKSGLTLGNAVFADGPDCASAADEITATSITLGVRAADFDGDVTVSLPAETLETADSGIGMREYYAASSDRFQVGAKRPAVTLSSTASADVLTPFDVTISFDEAVTGFAAADVSVANGTASAFTETVAGRTWTVRVAPAAAGTVTVSVAAGAAADANGNPSKAGTLARSAATPEVSAVRFASTPPGGQPAYGIDDAVTLEVEFSNAVTVTGTPQLDLSVGSRTRQADYTGGSGGTVLTFSYPVVSGDEDTDGAAIPANGLKLNGGTIQNAVGATAAELAHSAMEGGAAQKVDGIAPSATGAAVDGETLTVTFDEALDEIAEPAGGDFTVTVAGSARAASSVEVDGTTVTLTLASPVGRGETVTLTYAPGADPVRDLAKNDAAAISTALEVENETLAAPDAPTGLSAATSTTDPLRSVVLTWTAPSDNGGAAITGYRIESSDDGGGPTGTWTDLEDDTGNTNASFTDNTLAPGMTRHYRVSAINSVGPGEASDEDDATTGTVTAVFGAATYAATEGAGVQVTVTLTPAFGEAVTIPLTATPQGSAAADDFTAPTTVAFGASQTTKTFTFSATADTEAETGESVLLGFDTLPAGVVAGAQSTATVTIADANRPATGKPAITGTARVGATLTAGAGTMADPDGLPAESAFSYQWIVNDGTTDSDVAGATAKTYDPVAGDEGKTLKVRVDFSDDAGNAESLTSDPTGPVAAASARVVTLVLTPDEIGENGGVSTVTATVSPASPAAFTVEVAAAPVAPAVAADFTLSATPTLSFAAGATASTGAVTVTAVNNDLDAADKEVTVSGTVTGGTNVPDPAAATLTITDDDAPPSATIADASAPEADGTVEFTVTLSEASGREVAVPWTTADGTATTADSDYTAVTDGSVIVAIGATMAKIMVSVTDDEKEEPHETFTVTLAAPADGSATLGTPSSATGTITNDDTNSEATGQPEITGTARVGETLTAGVGTMADADGLPAESEFSYQWIRNDGTMDSDIAGAAGMTYDPAAADVGKTLKVRVSFTDNKGNDENRTSDPTAAVTAANRPATGKPSITGTPRVGATLTAGVGTMADPDGLPADSAFTYQWISNDGTTDSDIGAATGKT